MTFEKAKLFWKMNMDVKKIHCLTYEDNTEYYSFLRKCSTEGYRQVIISSEIMIQLIREACLEKQYKIQKIEFIEEDAELENEISNILRQMDKNPAYLSDLISKLEFLAEKSSIDLKRVYFVGLYNENHSIRYFIQSNGIIGINKESFSNVVEYLSASIERCLGK